jgi:dTDP-4-dehydrorhamnose 3,5-epimerase
VRIVETALPGLLLLVGEPQRDSRGYFARVWDASEVSRRGHNARVHQTSVAFNSSRGTLRGLHYQEPPYSEAKTVRCSAGAIYDVAVDLREDSPTRLQWLGLELSATNWTSLYIPEGFAHGYMTLTDGAEVHYQISAAYRAEAARGIRWNDPALDIRWPIPIAAMSERDAGFPVLAEMGLL